MDEIEKLRELFSSDHLNFLKNVSIDNAIFGYHNKELKILLQQPPFIQKWSLAGGFIKRTESVDEAAARIAKEIIGEALKALRMHLNHYPIGYELLPEKFTLPELHSLYETILGKKLDRRNFSKKLLATGLIKKLDERKSIGPHRSPGLYMFDKVLYDKFCTVGMVLAT
jgi:ADP-ribose pyrophosphatase YjhB (NUDIX family)